MKTVNDREQFLIEVNHQLPEKAASVELGVLHGDFSKMILEIINPRSLWLIDPFNNGGKKYNDGLNTAYSTIGDYHNIVERFKEELIAWKLHIQRCYSFEAVKTLMDGIFDFIYHDASHLYGDIKRDLKEWLPKLKASGLMCGHDYINFQDFGVIQAVDEFCAEHNFEMIILNENGGDYALKKIA